MLTMNGRIELSPPAASADPESSETAPVATVAASSSRRVMDSADMSSSYVEPAGLQAVTAVFDGLRVVLPDEENLRGRDSTVDLSSVRMSEIS
jgi:hypothetical protein